MEAMVCQSLRCHALLSSDAGAYLESRELAAGDVILLASGGHGFEALEEIEMIEVKQGPYIGDADKTRIKGITASQVKTFGPCKSIKKSQS
jgi:hypothetical protein